MMEATTTDALSASPHFNQVRMSSDLPVHSADICQAGTLCAVTNGTRNLADYQTGAVDPCGTPVFVYTDDHGGGGDTVVARQTSGTNLYTTNPCTATAANLPGSGQTVVGPATQPNAAAAVSTPNTGAVSPAITPTAAAGALLAGLALRRRRRRGPRVSG